MTLSTPFRHSRLPALMVAALLWGTAVAQQEPPRAARPPMRVAQNPRQPSTQPVSVATQPLVHPLEPAVRWAKDGFVNIQKIQDYSATLVKRERINGRLGEPQYIFIKVRHRPFSVYMYFLGPEELKGREVLYVEGKNDGKMWAHGTGVEKALGTLSLAPDGLIAMRGQRYPLTEIGILNLVRRLIEVAENDMAFGECDVKFFKGAEINKRKCTCIQVVHPVPRRDFLFHIARIFVDDELNLPLRYEAHDWPKKPGGPAELMEEYTYVNLKLNVGFTDADFDIRNPNYNF